MSQLPRKVGFSTRKPLAITVTLHGGKPNWTFVKKKQDCQDFDTSSLRLRCQVSNTPFLGSSCPSTSWFFCTCKIIISLLFKKGIQDTIKRGKPRYVSKIKQKYLLSGGKKIIKILTGAFTHYRKTKRQSHPPVSFFLTGQLKPEYPTAIIRRTEVFL